jgi:CRP/FNR family cyclic AMP-dependent transcriptional regulator
MNSYTEEDNNRPELQRNLELLNELPFFASFPDKAMKLIAFVSERDTFAQNELLVEQGDDAGQAYLVLSGTLVLYDRRNGQERELRTFQPGDFLGSLALLGPMPSLFMLKAQTDATVLTINRKQFNKIFQQFPETFAIAVKAVLKNLHQWERKNMNRAGECCLRNAGATAL